MTGSDDVCEVCRQGQGQPRVLYDIDFHHHTLPEEVSTDIVDFHICSGCHVSWEEYRDRQVGASSSVWPGGDRPAYVRFLRLLTKHHPDALTHYFIRWVIERLLYLECEEHRRSLKQQLRSRFISAQVRSNRAHDNDRNPRR